MPSEKIIDPIPQIETEGIKQTIGTAISIFIKLLSEAIQMMGKMTK